MPVPDLLVHSSPMAPTPRVYINDRHCIRCGRSELETPFSNVGSLRCDDCVKIAEAERKAYESRYQRARTRALRLLINAHQRQFARLMREEMAKVEAIDAAKAAADAKG